MGRKIDYKSFALFDLFLIIIAVLFVIITLLKLETQKGNITTKAEYVITVTWPDNDSNDIDSWLKDPSGKTCWYRDRDIGLTNLDRDDLGIANDTYYLGNGRYFTNPYNQELTTIRGCIEGEWWFNIHMFRLNNTNGSMVMVKIEKLNPTVEVVAYQEILLSKPWQEITIAHFRLDKDCEFIFLDNVYKPIAVLMRVQKERGGD